LGERMLFYVVTLSVFIVIPFLIAVQEMIRRRRWLRDSEGKFLYNGWFYEDELFNEWYVPYPFRDGWHFVKNLWIFILVTYVSYLIYLVEDFSFWLVFIVFILLWWLCFSLPAMIFKMKDKK
jgi:hypothetical protein